MPQKFNLYRGATFDFIKQLPALRLKPHTTEFILETLMIIIYSSNSGTNPFLVGYFQS
ncbi:hypothetical protein NMYAN_100100 [Nitrosomonas nitrosa]|uniref:Uncharacterized protein n=1 Tax=Nitrosomonas nitrosa TaxID=52442 RepID=A0A8H8YYZ8_9PROT|nr:hypothetical protein NMYAN_100100 [Nitrosomonas nitrosa]